MNLLAKIMYVRIIHFTGPPLLLRLHGFKVSMSGKGNCFDNAAMETFFKTIKAELIWWHSWPTRRGAEITIFEYIIGFHTRTENIPL